MEPAAVNDEAPGVKPNTLCPSEINTLPANESNTGDVNALFADTVTQ